MWLSEEMILGVFMVLRLLTIIPRPFGTVRTWGLLLLLKPLMTTGTIVSSLKQKTLMRLNLGNINKTHWKMYLLKIHINYLIF